MVIVSCVATPGVRVVGAEVAPVSAGALKFKVNTPAAPVMVRLVKFAMPLLFVSALVAPPSVPPPVATVAVTVKPARLTALPEASHNWSNGCCANGAPLAAVAEG